MSRSISEVQWEFLEGGNPPEIRHTTRQAYDQITRLNPSSMSAGLCGRIPDPFAVKLAWESPQSTASSDAMDRGTLAHMMILEPHRIADEVAIWQGDRRAGKLWDEFNERHAGKLIIRTRDYSEVQTGAMITANNPAVRDLLAGCEVEQACLWSEGNIACKGLVDAVGHKTPIGTVNLIDLKTTQRIDELSCIRTIQAMNYREKMAMYRRCVAAARGVEKDMVRVSLVFVKLEPPYGVNIMSLSSDGLDWAERRMLSVVQAVERCIDSGIWNPITIQSGFGLTSYEQHEEERYLWGEDSDDE